MNFKYLASQDHRISVKQEYLELLVYSSVSFLVPFFIAGPQLIVGTIVNSMLVLGAFNLRSNKLIPLIMLPSLGVFVRGVIFGPFSIYLLLLIPFIWVSNYLLVLMVKKSLIDKQRYEGVFLGVMVKVGFLAIVSYLLVSAGIIPEMFIYAMGVLQLYTAVMGSLIALGIQKTKSFIR